MITNAAAIHSRNKSYLSSSPDVITDISNGFTELTGYLKDDLVNKDLSEVFTTLLRSPKESLEKIKEQNSIECYIFTKSLEPREVSISLSQGQSPQNKVYTLVEKPNSRLDDKLIFEEQLFKDNKIGCSIYSVPDLILLKANQKYLDFMDPPYNILENNLGSSLFESVPGFVGSNSDELFSTVMKTGKPSYYNEYKYDHYERGVTYWDGSVIPIFSDNKIKYIYQTVVEITEQILQKNDFEKQAKIINNQYLKLTRQNELLSRQTRLLNLPNEAIFAWDLNGGITYWNKGAEKRYGYSSKEAIGCVSHDLLKTVHPNEIDDIELVLARDGFWCGEIEHTCKGGRKIIVETSQQVILDERGKHVVLETNRDITDFIKTRDELNHKKEQLREQKEDLEAILENMSDAIAIFDVNGEYTFTNHALKELYPETEISKLGDGYVTAKFFDANCKELPMEEMAAAKVKNGQRVTEDIVTMVRGDELIHFSISGTPLFDSNGKVRLGIISTRDVSGRFEKEMIIRNQQRALLNAEIEKNEVLLKAIEMKDELISQIELEKRRMKTMIDNLPVAIGIIDSNGQIIEVNDATLQMWGGKAPLSKNTSEYEEYRAWFNNTGKQLEPEDWPITKVLKTGEAIIGDVLDILRFDGTRGIYINSAVPLKDDKGNIINIFSFAVEITKQMQIEKEKKETLEKAIEMKDEFLALISHELKTPLTVISSAIQTMELVCKNELSDKARGYLNKIEQNTNRQLKLVNNILDNTRLNAGRFKINKKNIDIVLLTRTITEATTIFAEQKGIKLSFSSTIKEKVISIDEEQYEKILLNLLSNAIKFTPKGKAITVKVSQRTVEGIAKVCIKVKDEGLGIPGDKRDLIFERFGQVDSSLSRQAEGSGIGLSIVKMLIEMHSGEIKLDSKEGVGSTFTIILPETKSNETAAGKERTEKSNDSLLKAASIEFSDVYLK